jgi:hypothetical protein
MNIDMPKLNNVGLGFIFNYLDFNQVENMNGNIIKTKIESLEKLYLSIFLFILGHNNISF